MNQPLLGAPSLSFGRLTQQKFFESVLLLMGLGLVVTAGIAYLIAWNDATMSTLFSVTQTVDSNGEPVSRVGASTIWWVAAMLQLAMVLAISWGGLGKNMSLAVGIPLFIFYAGLNGVTIAPVLFAYTAASVAKVFFITGITFLGCALWGMTTKRDLTGMGTFFLYALIGLIVAMVVNLIVQAPLMDYLVSAAAIVLFAGLTAYDMQMLRRLHSEGGNQDGLIVYGALSLYLDFINLFLHLLRFFGVRVPGHGD